MEQVSGAAQCKSSIRWCALKEIRRITKKFPPLYHYVFEETEETEYTIDGKPNLFQQLHRYDNVLSIQKILIDIAISSTVFSNKFGMKRFEKMSFEGNTEILFPADYRIENGKLHFVLADITKTLEGIDARRLKWCKECRSIFWAYRLDARCCSDKCGNLFRVKESQRKKAEKEKLEKEKRQKFLNQDFGKK